MSLEHSFEHLETPHGRIRLRRQRADAPRLLLSADGPNVLEHYDDLLRHLAGRLDVTIFEPPGTGGSPPRRDFDFSLGALASVTEAVIRAQDLGPVALGLSCYLGFVSQLVASRSPSLVSRVLLLQTPSLPDMHVWLDRVDRRRWLRTPLLGQALVRALRPRVVRGWYQASVGHRECLEPFCATALHTLSHGGCFRLADLMQGLAHAEAPPRSAHPVDVLWGAKDRSHRRSDPARACPGAPVTVFEHAGHCPELEEPARFADLVTSWLR